MFRIVTNIIFLQFNITLKFSSVSLRFKIHISPSEDRRFLCMCGQHAQSMTGLLLSVYT